MRITGLKDKDNVEGETKELLDLMRIELPMHTWASRVGKNSEKDGEKSKERALILYFPSMEVRKNFLKKRPALKETRIFLRDNLTPTQITHMKRAMPKIRAAKREKGKTAFYKDGRVVIVEQSSK